MKFTKKLHFLHYDEDYIEPDYFRGPDEDEEIPSAENIELEVIPQICRLPNDDMDLFDKLMKKWAEIFSREINIIDMKEPDDNTFSVDNPNGTYTKFFETDESIFSVLKGIVPIMHEDFEDDPWIIDYFSINFANKSDLDKKLSIEFAPFKNLGTRLAVTFENGDNALTSGVMIVQRPDQQTDGGLCYRNVFEMAGYQKLIKPFENFIEKILSAEYEYSKNLYDSSKKNAFDALDSF